MKKLALMGAIAFTTFSLHPAFAEEAKTDTARIAELERQVRSLSVVVNNLRAEVELLKSGRSMMRQPSGTAPEDCEAQVAALTERRDKLGALGYAPKHPDMMQLEHQINTLKAGCAAAG
ncbi:hypothetical protein [Kordiimonas sp.]|uniref:hypothetical protein n=1 Tax=Kordiimonas sp. TaxID=1970157 RepID=UPI003A951A29